MAASPLPVEGLKKEPRNPLGVPTASTEEIKARYRQSILRIYSDVDRPVALFRQIKQAYEVLSDPMHRALTINSSMLVLMGSNTRVDPKALIVGTPVPTRAAAGLSVFWSGSFRPHQGPLQGPEGVIG